MPKVKKKVKPFMSRKDYDRYNEECSSLNQISRTLGLTRNQKKRLRKVKGKVERYLNEVAPLDCSLAKKALRVLKKLKSKSK